MQMQVMDGHDPVHVRGDPMPGDRYYSKEFAAREWEHMWKKVWHVAGRANELQELDFPPADAELIQLLTR